MGITFLCGFAAGCIGLILLFGLPAVLDPDYAPQAGFAISGAGR